MTIQSAPKEPSTPPSSLRDRTKRIAELIGPPPAARDAAFTSAVGEAAGAPPELPVEVVSWLTQLTLLYGVPFEYLVADARLLPSESARFFYMDRNWLDRAIDGALSIAVLSTMQAVFNEAFFEAVYQAILEKQQAMRAELRKKTPAETLLVGSTYSGMLVRSVVVSGWPGLEIAATKGGSPVSILRMDRLSRDALLVLFADVPDTINVIEPSEGLHFGVFDDPAPQTDGKKHVLVNLRGLGFGGQSAGVQIKPGGNPITASTTMRSGATQPVGVLDIASLVRDIGTKMPAGALGPTNQLTSGGFAIQMVRGAGLHAFTTSATKDCRATSSSEGKTE